MKLEAKTIDVLKNFSLINPSILIKEGNVLSTISPVRHIVAKAKVPTNFTKRFAIYNLPQFLGSVSLYDDANLDFADEYVVIGDKKKSSINYTYASETVIKAAPEKDNPMPSVDIKFEIKANDLKDLIKHCGVLQLHDVAVVGDGSNIYLQGFNSDNPTGNLSKIIIGETDKTFKAIFKQEHLLKLIDSDYQVELSTKGISHFVGNDVEYWIIIQPNSQF